MDSEYKPPRKRHTSIGFLLACAGLFSLNWAANLLAANQGGGAGWLVAVGGLALIVLGVLWATRRE